MMEVAEVESCKFSLSQIISKAFNLINKSNAHPEGCLKWKLFPYFYKKWANLKTQFALEAKYYHKK